MSDTIGHNSGADKLLSYFDRYERLGEEIAAIRDAQKDILIEMRGNGYDADDIKAFKELIAERKKDQDKLARVEERKNTMRGAMANWHNTPLGAAAE